MRVFIADDEEKIRSALQILLKYEPDLRVVGEADKVDGLLAQVQATRPELILLDWELPDQPTAALLAAIHALPDCPKIVVVSSRPEAEKAALSAGADVFVGKGDPADRFLAVLQAIQWPGV